MSTERAGSGSGDTAQPASSRFRIDVVPTSRSRRLATFLPSLAAGLFGEIAPKWPPRTVRVMDRQSGRCVFEPDERGDSTDYAPVLQADLDRMSVDEFCEQWGIDREEVGLGPQAVPPPVRRTEPMNNEDLAAAAGERLLRFVGEGVVGMVVGLVAGDRELIVSRGPVSTDGVFDIGSITKVFTGVLLADMACRGEVDLEDPVARFLPNDVRTPRWDGREITLVDLATHTSGLPRLPRNLLVRATLHGSDPYRGYTEKDLHHGLAATKPRRAPGSVHQYSNFGFAVLAHALAAAAGDTYERLVVERVCRPLGLLETMVELTPDLARRRERGHGPSGQPVPDWELAAFAGAGALRSTGPDMVRFLRASLDPGGTALAAALDDAQRPRRQIRAGEEIGLGWHLRHEGCSTVAWHNGGTGGFGGFLALARERGTGVVALYNSPPSPAVDAAAFELLAQISG